MIFRTSHRSFTRHQRAAEPLMNNIAGNRKMHATIRIAGLLALLPGVSFAADVIEIPRVPSAEEVQFSALADAAMARDNDQVLALLNAENPAQLFVDVNALGRYGTPALHWVIRYGERAIAERLVAEGADVNLANIYGVRPLQLAIENGHRDLVQWLLDSGADP